MRRVSVVAAVLITGLALSGCSQVSDGDVVARVDDTVLDRDTFTQLVTDLEALDPSAADPQNDPDRANGDTARFIAGRFVTLELVRNDLDRMGVAVPPVDTSLTGYERFDAEFQAAGQTWVAQAGEVLGDEELQTWYQQGASTTGVACVQHILVAEESEAQAVLDRLEQGEAFGDVAAQASLDTQSGAQGGVVGCQPLSAFSEDFVDGALLGEFGVPSQPVESPLGHHVVRIMPFEELSPDDVIRARLIALGQWHDIEIDPEIGEWQSLNVQQLG